MLDIHVSENVYHKLQNFKYPSYVPLISFAHMHVLTRAVRGSDNSPATALSEEKDKLVTENWKDREKKNPSKDYTKTTCTSSFHLQSFKTISTKL